jgi:DNA polymerase I-like protein with 3'-5' exonuclease and polymerase domains
MTPEYLDTNPDELRQAIEDCTEAVLDFESSAVQPLFAAVTGLGVYLPEPNRVFYLNTGHTQQHPDIPKISEQQLRSAMQPFLADPARTMIAHNAPYELRLLQKLGLQINCRVHCTLIGTHRTDENLRSDGTEPTLHRHLDRVTYGLKELTLAFFNEIAPTYDAAAAGANMLFADPAKVAAYCAQDCLNTWRLYQRTQEIAGKDQHLRKLLRNIDEPNNLPLARMMSAGILIDADEAERQKTVYTAAIQRCRDEIWETLKINWPLDTPRQVNAVLRHLGIRIEDGSVGSEALLELFHETENETTRKAIALFLSKGQMEQRIDAFLKPMPKKAGFTNNRLYPDRFASTLATTRFASSPNLQNLPGRADKIGDDDIWRDHLPPSCGEVETTRKIFIAKPAHVLVSGDLSAAEPKYLALLFQRALLLRDGPYWRDRADLDYERRNRWPILLQRMYDTRRPDPPKTRERIEWPDYDEDPLWQVFKYGKPFGDPYDALLAAIDKEGYQAAVERGNAADWLDENRWRGKKAFLALGYGGSAETLAPALKWTVERTQQAIESLESTYATLKPLRELTLLELIHIGQVRTLWNRPRRLNGYYQLARPNRLTVGFYRTRAGKQKSFRRYVARIIPLGSTINGVQAFVQECWIDNDDGTREIVLAGNMDGTLKRIDRFDPFAAADHFNRPPFRNINFAQLDWVEEENGLRRFLAKQSRALRQAFNSLCQSTGADHLRWLMNAVDTEILSQPDFVGCELILTLHDSLIFEVHKSKAEQFVRALQPIMSRRPYWSDIDFKVKIEVGPRFGDMRKA